ncbi:MAG: ATP-binding protein [Bradymonadaceae bacterium]
MVLDKLDDFEKHCQSCERKRYITRTKGDVALAAICEECFAVCPGCDGQDFTFVEDEQGYRYVQDCVVCTALKSKLRAFNDARIPARYHDHHATLQAFQTHETSGAATGKPIGNLPRVKLQLYDWAKGFVPGDRGFLLHGNVGTGKTHLLAAVVRHLTLEKGITARFMEFSHLLSQLREGFDQGRGEAALLGPLVDVPVLAIDELGKGRNNDWQLSVIDEIISKRYNRGLTTLCTTNYLLEQTSPNTDNPAFRRQLLAETLSERVGERIYSRLFEMADFLSIEAPDYRKR